MRLGTCLQAAAVVLVALVGCDSGQAPRGSGHDGGDPPLDGPAPDKLTLEVESAAQLQRAGFTSPTADNRFVGVSLVLKNTGEAAPLPVDMTTLLLETADLLLYQASAASQQAAMACPTAVAVEAGGELRCQVTFEIPWTTRPKGLVYADSMGHSARANIATVMSPKILCRGWPTALPNCAYCLNQVCTREAVAMTTACAAETNTGCLVPDRCPELQSGCAALACQIALDTYQGCLFDFCHSSCQ